MSLLIKCPSDGCQCTCELRSKEVRRLNPIQTGRGGGGGGLLRPRATLKPCNFQTVKAMTTKLGDFS